MLSNTTLDSIYSLRRRELRRTMQFLYSWVGSRVNVGEQMGGEGEDGGGVPAGGGGDDRAVGEAQFVRLFSGLARFDLQGIQKKTKGLVKRFDRIFENIIDQRLKMDGHGSGTAEESVEFLQFLLKLKDDGDAKRLSPSPTSKPC
ncbi:unnamed protein product [Camellia sinensis]